MKDIAESLKAIADFFKAIGKIIYVISHPIIIWNWFMDISFWLACISICVCIIIYAATKIQKSIQIAWLIIVVFILLKGVDLVI
jgi:hypothetical protein